MPFLGTESILPISQVENRAVVNDLSLIITPHCIGNSTRFDFSHVAGNEAIEKFECVGTANAVLGHRCQIENTGSISDRKVFRFSAIKCVGT